MIKVPIFMYHCIGYYPNRWHRTPGNFRKDLDALYSKGYRCVPVEDIVFSRVDLSKTKKPFSFRFDDNTEDQFSIKKKKECRNNGIKTEYIHQKSLMGILERFKEKHPGFGKGGIFYICANRFRKDRAIFGQPKFQKMKLEYLLDKGYELGNHTYGHESLSKLTPDEMRETIDRCDRLLEGFIGDRISEVRSFAFPMGDAPKDADKEKIIRGRFDYMIARRAGPLTYPYPQDELYAVPRIEVTDKFDMKRFLEEMERQG